MIPLLLLAFVIGSIIGSFLNVCIYRLPRDLSLVRPRSYCPTCSAPIRFYDNIPVLSYVMLRGKCRNCGAGISLRYPLVEVLNGLLYTSVLAHFGWGWHLVFLFVFVSAMIVVTFIDLDFQIIPDNISLPGIVIGLIGASFFIPDPFAVSHIGVRSILSGFQVVGFWNSLIGLFAGYGLFYIIANVGETIAKTEAMGKGDLKLMAMIGASLGWKAVILTTFAGSLAGSVIGIFWMAIKGQGQGRKAKIPFGPFLALGALITLFFGGTIFNWYFGLM